MSASPYIVEVQSLTRPTAGQIDAFVQHVSAAHSWYKHLPLLPPGTPFFFYLNPNAGRETVVVADTLRYRGYAI